MKIYDNFAGANSPEKSVRTAKSKKKNQTPSKSAKSKKKGTMSPNNYAGLSGQKRSKSKGKRAKSKGKSKSSKKEPIR